MLNLSDLGAIHGIDLRIGEPVSHPTTQVEWTSEIETLRVEAVQAQADISPVAARDMSEVDLSHMYEGEECGLDTRSIRLTWYSNILPASGGFRRG